jgi:D-alanine-D-alanine ligase
MSYKVAIITGGQSTEREVSLWSAEFVLKALREEGVDARVIVLPGDSGDIYSGAFDVAIPMIHGRGGEDGAIQRHLDTFGIPYLFSSPATHEIGIDKEKTKKCAREVGVNCAKGELVSKISDITLPYPYIIKPVDGGSTIDVVIVKSDADLITANDVVNKYPSMLAESYVSGREFTVGVLEDDGAEIALPVAEIVAEDGFFDFDCKYTDGLMAEEICPANIGEELASKLQDAALQVHRAVGARHMTRSDFIVDDAGEIWFLEINTIPGLTRNSLFPKILPIQGKTLGGVLNGWICEIMS